MRRLLRAIPLLALIFASSIVDANFVIFQVSVDVVPSVICNIVTGIATGTGSGTCASPTATCDGNSAHDDAAAFASFNNWAVNTWQVSHVGLIELDIPHGATCMFIGIGNCANGSSCPGDGIKQLRIVGLGYSGNGDGATFSDNGGLGGARGFFLGSFKGIFQDNTHSARFQTVASGASCITLVTAAQNSLFSVDTYALITGVDMQGFGFPPTPYVFEWLKIASINAGTGQICFNTPLSDSYKSTWPLYNAGSAFEADQGGPATIYVVSPSWDTQQEYRGITFAQTDSQTYTIGRDITFRNVAFTGTHCGVPTQNGSWRVINGDMTNCSMEVDKIIDTLTLTNVAIRIIDFQSASTKYFTVSGGSVTTALNGSAKTRTTITNASISSFAPGARLNGASGAVSISNSVLSDISFGGRFQSNVNLRGTWSNGRLAVPHNFAITSAANNGSGLIRLLVNSTAGYSTGFVTDVSGTSSCDGTWPITVIDETHFDLQGSTFVATCSGTGGSLPLSWAVPGANIYWAGQFGTQGPVVQVTDISQDATFTYAQTTLPGGFPAMPLNSGAVAVNVHPAPSFTCTLCTGSVDAVDLSNPGAAGLPLWSYSKRTLTATNGNPTTPVVPVWGALVSANVTVSVAYTGASLSLNFNNPFVQIPGSSSAASWNPTVNTKVASGAPRVMTQTTTSGAQSGDSLVAAGANAWLLNNQLSPEWSANISGSGDPVTATVEFITNQGVVYP